MNADPNWSDGGGQPEPEIIVIGIDRKSYHLLKGDAHLNQMLLADGTFPKPIVCLHFKTVMDVRMKLGETVRVPQLWAIHPEIVERLRADEDLIEKDAS